MESQFTSHVRSFENSNVYALHIPVPKDVVLQWKGTDRLRVRLNDQMEWSAAILPSGHETWYLLLNKERVKKLFLTEGSEVQVLLTADTSKYGMDMPEEFEVLLEQDEVGSRYFHELTPGKQRNLIHIVGKLKNTDKRIQKALVILEHLVLNQGALDFRQLNEDFKAANRR